MKSAGPIQNGLVATCALALLMTSACQHGEAEGGSVAPPACPATWLEPPVVDASIALPISGAHLVLHAAAAGTQNYACKLAPGDGGAAYAWSLVGPDATLSDCSGAPIGRHFPTDAGKPEWQMADGSYVVAHKLAPWSPGGSAMPWLLLEVDSKSGSAPIASARYVQKVRTTGGLAPATGCDASQVGFVQKVVYTADYFFYAP